MMSSSAAGSGVGRRWWSITWRATSFVFGCVVLSGVATDAPLLTHGTAPWPTSPIVAGTATALLTALGAWSFWTGARALIATTIGSR
jgi:hypothetical protein